MKKKIIWYNIKLQIRILFEFLVVILTFFYVIIRKFLGKRFYTVADIPKLANIKNKEPYDVYIGRPNIYLNLPGSIWGNPFPVDENGKHIKFKPSMREQVLKDHMVYLKNNKKLLKELKTLSGKTLGCYCYSSATGNGTKCHGDNIIEMYKQVVLKLDSTLK